MTKTKECICISSRHETIENEAEYLIEYDNGYREWITDSKLKQLIRNKKINCIFIENNTELDSHMSSILAKLKIMDSPSIETISMHEYFKGGRLTRHVYIWGSTKVVYLIIPDGIKELPDIVSVKLRRAFENSSANTLKVIGGKGLISGNNICKNLDLWMRQLIIDLTALDTGAMKSTRRMFKHTTFSQILGLEKLKLNNVTNAEEMFAFAHIYGDYDLCNLKMPKLKFTKEMFHKFNANKLNLCGIKTDNIVSYNSMFSHAEIKQLDFDIRNIKEGATIEKMFMQAQIDNINLGKFDTYGVLSMCDAFHKFSSNKLSLPNLTVANVGSKGLERTFYKCGVGELYIPKFKPIEGYHSAKEIFVGCSSNVIGNDYIKSRFHFRTLI